MPQFGSPQDAAAARRKAEEFRRLAEDAHLDELRDQLLAAAEAMDNVATALERRRSPEPEAGGS